MFGATVSRLVAAVCSFLLIASVPFGVTTLLANAEPVIVMEDTTETTGQSLWSGRPVHAEYVTPTSILVGKLIDSITVSFKEVGSAPGTVQVGIINADLSMKKVFGTMSASAVATSYTPYEFTLASGDSYTIQAGDRIGAKYTAGSDSNRLSIMRDTTGGFDGTNTYHTTYTSGWNTYTSVDLTMTLKYSGSGGGGTNSPPVSNAGPDQTVNEGALVTLDGTGSTDPDGAVVSYSWTQSSGPAVTLSSQTAAQPTFAAPSVSSTTILEFSLVVTDDDGAASTEDTVEVTVNDVSSGDPPSQPPGIVMEETTTTTGQSVWSGRPVHAEYVTATSALVGKYIDSITISLKKVGSTPPGTAQIGIINTDLSMKKVFSTINPSTLPTSYTSAEYKLGTGDCYLIQAGDRIGVKYTAGTSSTYIAIMRDTTGGYDGTNTYHTTYTSAWNTYTSVDLTMTLKYYGGCGGSDTTPPTVSVTHSPTNPSSSSTVSFTASASDNFGLNTIEIFVDGSSLGSCTVSGTSADCMKSGGPYASGSSHTYYAEAYDGAGLSATSSTGNFLVSSSPPPSGSLPTAESVFNTETFTVPHQVSHFIMINPTHGHHDESESWIAPTNALYLPENLIISQNTAVTLLAWDDHGIHQLEAKRADNGATEWTTPVLENNEYSPPHTFSAATLYNIQDIYDAPDYNYDQSHIKGTITTQTPTTTTDGTIVGAMYVPQSFDRSLITSKGFTIESEYDYYKVWKHLPYDNTLVIFSTQQSLSATMLDLQAIVTEVDYD